VKDADLLLHLVDASDPDPEGQIAAVQEVLDEVGADQVAQLIVFNKTDISDPLDLARLRHAFPDAPMISAITGEGVPELIETLAELLKANTIVLRLSIPYERGDILAAAHRIGEVLAEKHEDDRTVLEARVPLTDQSLFDEFVAT